MIKKKNKEKEQRRYIQDASLIMCALTRSIAIIAYSPLSALSVMRMLDWPLPPSLSRD